MVGHVTCLTSESLFRRKIVVVFAVLFLSIGRFQIYWGEEQANLGFVWLNKGFAAESSVDGFVAGEYFSRALATLSSDSSWRRGFGFALFVQGKGEEAVGVWRGMPEMYDELVQWGHIAFDAGKLADARQWYGLAVEVLPARIEAWYYLGNVALRENRVKDALDAYHTALERVDDLNGLVHYGDVYCQMGWLYHWLVADAGRAAVYYDMAEENGRFSSSQQQSDCLFKRAELFLWRLDQPVQAADDYAAVVALEPTHLQAQATMYFAQYLATNRLAESEQQLGLLAEQHPNSVWIYWRLGDLYHQAGMLSQAQVNYRRALAIEPTNTHLQSLLEQIEGHKIDG